MNGRAAADLASKLRPPSATEEERVELARDFNALSSKGRDYVSKRIVHFLKNQPGYDGYSPVIFAIESVPLNSPLIKHIRVWTTQARHCPEFEDGLAYVSNAPYSVCGQMRPLRQIPRNLLRQLKQLAAFEESLDGASDM